MSGDFLLLSQYLVTKCTIHTKTYRTNQIRSKIKTCSMVEAGYVDMLGAKSHNGNEYILFSLSCGQVTSLANEVSTK